ncbi:glycerophosphoryl diester phosphodiesterase [Homoserinimonas aerilata]|uniref:Glycerophosphoryl diester phosphodiesterase n=1 Tax=Homoserinimonas aerilata TaxID=1162970 RepID=A0A542YJ60_9MICO|nr:glycerophosphodiester phosphodiesterase [Homoserinimonas aerilata]TQL48112.1 glycerophosphoryl diester phosphodiesterase [Homoserinimonas aerilata]
MRGRQTGDGTSSGFLSPAPPRVIAHRGLALEAPENTKLAFLKALSIGVTHLETDVHASADGVAVVSHDPDLVRVAGREVRVDQLTMAELRRIDLGEGQGFSSLAEVLDAFPDARFNIDVKVADAVAPTIEAIREARAVDRVLIASFDNRRRLAVLDALPGAATSASSSGITKALVALRVGSPSLVARALGEVDAVQIPVRYGALPLVTARNVRLLHAAGVEVHVWTINEPAEMGRLLDLGVDGIVTDRADLALDVLRSRL